MSHPIHRNHESSCQNRHWNGMAFFSEESAHLTRYWYVMISDSRNMYRQCFCIKHAFLIHWSGKRHCNSSFLDCPISGSNEQVLKRPIDDPWFCFWMYETDFQYSPEKKSSVCWRGALRWFPDTFLSFLKVFLRNTADVPPDQNENWYCSLLK